MAMIRKFLIAVAASALLAGCVSDYAYRGGSGDYYYGRSSAYGYGYGAPYSSIGYGYPGGWYGSYGYGYGYPYGYYGYGYRPYYYYPYYRPHRPHRPHRPDDKPRPVDGPVMAGPRPAIRRAVPPPAGAGYTRLPARRGDAPMVPVRPRGDGEARPRSGGQPMVVRPRQQAPMRAAVPERSRPAPRAQAPAPRAERRSGRESPRQREE